MALFTRCILGDVSEEDGLRISVMSRHTLEDGKTPDRRITSDIFDLHMPELAPSPELVGAWYRGEINWGEFKTGYGWKMRHAPMDRYIEILCAIAKKTDVTILCIEQEVDHCHRRLLAERCLEVQPDLVIEYR
ncbi:DUF488 domain-containing protein [Patescibacteria group bacterium]